jgi:hypothetical protein
LALSYKKHVVLSSALFRLKQFGGSQLSTLLSYTASGLAFFLAFIG